ncbi:MAG: PaaI family thioesterase [Prevotella sp.]|jgi:1,4-dihydroxy-2-naphthoyl-CoA hydrolase
MNIEKQKTIIEQQEGLSNTLGMEFLSTPEPDTCMARMKVDKLNRQPFGFLSGGATLALAENLAGVGSMSLCPEKISVGINVSGNHISTVLEGDTVTAYGKLLHQGRTLHVWQVDVRNSIGKLVSTVQVTNYVVNPKKDDQRTQASKGE